MAKVTADLHLMVRCHRGGCWNLGEKSEFAQFLNRGLLARRRHGEDRSWYFSLGHMLSVCVLAKAKVITSEGGHQCFALAQVAKENLRLDPISNPDEHECQPYNWISPLAFISEYRRAPPTFGLLAIPIGPPEGVRPLALLPPCAQQDGARAQELGVVDVGAICRT